MRTKKAVFENPSRRNSYFFNASQATPRHYVGGNIIGSNIRIHFCTLCACFWKMVGMHGLQLWNTIMKLKLVNNMFILFAVVTNGRDDVFPLFVRWIFVNIAFDHCNQNFELYYFWGGTHENNHMSEKTWKRRENDESNREHPMYLKVERKKENSRKLLNVGDYQRDFLGGREKRGEMIWTLISQNFKFAQSKFSELTVLILRINLASNIQAI